MKNNNLKTEVLYLEIPFHEWIDADLELMNALFDNYINIPQNIEKIKKFMINDYLESLSEDEFVKAFTSSKYKENVNIKKEEQNTTSSLENDDMPF